MAEKLQIYKCEKCGNIAVFHCYCYWLFQLSTNRRGYPTRTYADWRMAVGIPRRIV